MLDILQWRMSDSHILKYITFTRMQNDSNLRWPPPKIKHTWQGKMYQSKSQMAHQK